MIITDKDLQIFTQSYGTKAIELIKLVGFPKDIEDASPSEKIIYIQKRLTPYLVKSGIQIMKDISKELRE